MTNIKMNTELGKKWFVLYTKVRPWFICCAFLSTFLDFLAYADTYLSLWWMFFAFIIAAVQCSLAIIVFIKSRGDYEEFVHFIKGVLLFEAIATSYQQGVHYYINSNFDLGVALVVSAFIFLIGYFIWYRLNMKYFKKRIKTFVVTPESAPPPNNVSNIYYCTNCGNKLVDGNNFCGKCGTPVYHK